MQAKETLIFQLRNTNEVYDHRQSISLGDWLTATMATDIYSSLEYFLQRPPGCSSAHASLWMMLEAS